MPRPRAVSGPLREADRHVDVTVRTDPIAFQPPEGTVSACVAPPTRWDPLHRLHGGATRLYLDSRGRLHRMLSERRIDRTG